MADTQHSTYLIVGSGVFGVSTAYYLAKAHPSATITLIDRTTPPCSLAASYDFNKVVRADYGDPFYCSLALKAIEHWRNDPLYKDFYHQSGMVVLENTELGRKMIANYENLKIGTGSVVIGPEELKKKYGGVFEDTDYDGVEEIFVNPSSGWAEATPALTKVLEAAVGLGVKCIEGDIETLTFDANGACTGVRTTDGRTLLADNVILSTGAGTAKLLVDSASERSDLQSGNRITAAAVATAVIKLTPEEVLKLKDAPVFVHSIGETRGETMPPTPDGLIKFCRDVSFKNTIEHTKSGTKLSAPPDIPNQGQDVISKGLEAECLTVVKTIYGKEADNWKFDSFRVCWDGFTPNQDFIISKHSHCENLTIATGGSFHGWKFLPIIGEYVVKLLDGQLEDDLVKRWAWDREDHGAAHGTLIPEGEFRDL